MKTSMNIQALAVKISLTTLQRLVSLQRPHILRLEADLKIIDYGLVDLSVGLVLARLYAKANPIRHQDCNIRQRTMHGHPSTSRPVGDNDQ
jgi:hypothetical protein